MAVKQNWFLIAGVVGVLAVPFGIAAFQDSLREDDPGDPDPFGDDFAGATAAQTYDDIDYDEETEDIDDDDDEPAVGAWKRDETPAVDFSFLDDVLGKGVASLNPKIDAALRDPNLYKGELESLIDGFRESLDPSVSIEVKTGFPTELHVHFPLDEQALSNLRTRWGEPERAGGGWSWHNSKSGQLTILYSRDGVMKLSFYAR